MMSAEGEEKNFLSRWSRLKTRARQEAAAESAPAGAPPQDAGSAAIQQARDAGEGPRDAEAPAVPPVEALDMDSDYRPFFHPKIEEGVRRAALKKLFSDPHFNVMDGLDVYIDDYSKADPLPAGMLEQLQQAQKIFAWSREDAEERAKAEMRAASHASGPEGSDTPEADWQLSEQAAAEAPPAPAHDKPVQRPE
ncbi:MAG TPA: DUF3306 domain-containing protein [Burkholderiales bacterium]|nr:DUF3306 domain-containing protein [Burkholderiales bacterium]